MSITPEPPLKTCEGRFKHGSILNGNIWLCRVNSQRKSTLEASAPEFAFVDIQLQDGSTGIDFGRVLAKSGIPYVFVSGNIKKLPSDFAGALGAIEKPYTMNGIANALEYISSIVAGDEGGLPPASLVLAGVHPVS